MNDQLAPDHTGPSHAAHLRGEVRILPLAGIVPNAWNPNVVPEHVMESIRHGFRADGWLVSQALLVWGTDELGVARNIIIDGEHRWRAATAVGLEVGPQVVLDGLTEGQAKALTVKLNQKRGDWDEERLAELVAELSLTDPLDSLALDLGFAQDEVDRLVAYALENVPPVDALLEEPPAASEAERNLPDGADAPLAPGSSIRMVQLFLDDKSHPAFLKQVQRLAGEWGLKSVTDTVLEAVRRAAT